MYRFPLTLLFASIAACQVAGQTGQRQPIGSRQPAGARQPAALPTQQAEPKLRQLLSDWSRSSDQIEHLTGRHVRHVYDLAFETERISEGEFGYAKPDKGRITMKPYRITKALIASRKDPKAKVQRKTNGTPYDLKPDNPERWLCDGERVYDIDETAKEARVAQLPPEQRGKNIMNTPLPFLFGMPPDMALKRFQITISKDFRPQRPFVALEVLPRTMADSRSWSRAQVMLDTNTYLPHAVRLTDPAKTKLTLYSFSEMKTGRNLIAKIFGGDPWAPKLGDYKVHVVQQENRVAGNGAAQSAVPRAPNQQGGGQTTRPSSARNVFPNVVGTAHDKAEQALIAAGIPKANIKKKQAGPAPRTDLKYHVSAQSPPAGRPLDARTEVVLMIFTAPTTSRDAAKPAQQRRQ